MSSGEAADASCQSVKPAPWLRGVRESGPRAFSGAQRQIVTQPVLRRQICQPAMLRAGIGIDAPDAAVRHRQKGKQSSPQSPAPPHRQEGDTVGAIRQLFSELHLQLGFACFSQKSWRVCGVGEGGGRTRCLSRARNKNAQRGGFPWLQSAALSCHTQELGLHPPCKAASIAARL